MYRERLINAAMKVLLALVLVLCVLQCVYLYRCMERNRDSSMERNLQMIGDQLDGEMEQKRLMLDSVVGDTAKLLTQGAPKGQLEEYFYKKTDEMAIRTNGDCMSVYCANGEWQIMKDFTPDDEYEVRERLWYAGAAQAQGKIYITSPYVDYRTGKYHYSVVQEVEWPLAVCMDYSLEALQKEFEEYTSRIAGQFMLVDTNGMIYAHSSSEYAGRSTKDFPGYYDIVQKAVTFSGKVFYQELDGIDYVVCSRKLNSGRCLIAFAPKSAQLLFSAQSLTKLLLPVLVLAALIVLFVVLVVRALRRKGEHGTAEAPKDEILMVSVRQNRYLLLLIAIFLAFSAFFINQNIASRLAMEQTSMKNTAGKFGEIVTEWYGDVRDVLMYADYYLRERNDDQLGLGENCGELSDFLDSVLAESDVISNMFVYNASWEVPYIDTQGAEPDAPLGVKSAYSGAIALHGDYCVTYPYENEKNRVYCITISKAIYDRAGNFVCVAGVDCYMDKLINVLGTVQTEDGYAFLADRETNIINHPYEAYQMRAERMEKASELDYAGAFLDTGMVSVRDYDGVRRFCIVTIDQETGFYVVVMRNRDSIRHTMLRTVLIYFGVILFGIFIVVISQRNLYKSQIAVAQELKDTAVLAEQSSNAKSDFLANMSHEIRTPMNAIVGMCEMILREPDISDTVREYGYNIQNSGRSLLGIINDILDFSKIEAGKIDLVQDEFNIASTLNDVINMAVARKGDKNLELLVHVDPDIPVGLIGDELRIRQIIVNLVTNGIKYTNKGCVIITVSQTKQEYGINLSVSVKDTGIGISETNMEKLFNSFAQVDTKRNRAVEGTGLGLAISKRLIMQMGGFINVSSVYGEGSEFRFTIPLKVSDNAPFIKVKDPEKVHVIGFFGGEKFATSRIGAEYAKMIREGGEKLHAEIVLAASLEELMEKAQTGQYSHVHVGREEYLAEKEFFDELAKKCVVFVIQDRIGTIPLPPYVQCLYKPFYLLSVVALINQENIQTNLSRNKVYMESFTAPGARVLVVDDNAINLQVAEGLMRPYHMQVLTADSAKAALEKLQGKDFDLVFMDHMMPEIDGVEATKMIREMEDEYYRKLPIIALTANAVSGARNMFLEAGMNDFIAKPIEVSTLDRVLKTWLPAELIEAGKREEAQEQTDLSKMDEGTELFSEKQGIFYTGGDVESYYKILATYVEKGPEKRELIRKHFENEDWKNYVIEVHALKSTSLTIGSKQLSELAKDLELAGKTEDFDTIRQENGALVELYQQVLEIGGEKLSRWKEKNAADAVETKAATEEITAEALVDYRERIRAAVDGFDGDEIVAACEELAGFVFHGEALAERFEQVRNAANDFDYEQAGVLAEQVFGELLK